MPTDRCMLQGRQSSDDVKRTVLGPTDSFCSHTSVVAFVPMTSLKVARILDYRLPSTSVTKQYRSVMSYKRQVQKHRLIAMQSMTSDVINRDL